MKCIKAMPTLSHSLSQQAYRVFLFIYNYIDYNTLMIVRYERLLPDALSIMTFLFLNRISISISITIYWLLFQHILNSFSRKLPPQLLEFSLCYNRFKKSSNESNSTIVEECVVWAKSNLKKHEKKIIIIIVIRKGMRVTKTHYYK